MEEIQTVKIKIAQINEHVTKVLDEKKRDKAHIAYLEGFVKGLQNAKKGAI